MAEQRQPRPEEPAGEEAAPRPGVPCKVPWGTGTAVALIVLHLLLQFGIGTALKARASELVAHLAGAGLAGAFAVLLVWAVVGTARHGDATVGRLLGFGGTTLGRAVACWRILAVGALAYVVVGVATLVAWRRFLGDGEHLPLQRILWSIGQVESPAVLTLAVVAAVVVAPVIEEVLFRSVLYLPLRDRWGVVPAALLVSLLFAVMHFYAPGVAVLVVLSFIFIALFERSGTLWAPILAHAAYNGGIILVVRLFGLGASPA